jgi:hypothetical protein
LIFGVIYDLINTYLLGAALQRINLERKEWKKF